MKFLDKVKDLFSDEEEVIETEEVEVEEQKEHKLPTFMRNKIEEEQKREEAKKQREEELPKTNIISDREIIRTRTGNNFSFPIDMDDNDMSTELRYSNQNVLQKEREKEKTVSELYAKKEEPKPKKFKPTPVISPVYGILDKNYTKDEVKVQDENSYEIQRPSRKVDFETVRNKAFGNLTDDIKNAMCETCELYQEVKITKNADKSPKVEESNLLEDLTNENEDISLAEAEDNYFDFGVSYEPPKKPKKEEQEEVKIVNHNDEESHAEKIEVKEVKEEPKQEEKEEIKEELKDEDFLEKTGEYTKIEENNIDEEITPIDESNDIFNLIDSMYDEEEDK